MDNIIQLVENAPLLFQYIVPGSISLYLLSFILSKRFSKEIFLAISCVLSYAYLSCVKLIRFIVNASIPDTPLVNSGLATIIGIVVALILLLLFTTPYTNKLFVTLFHKTPNTSIWYDVVDFENGVVMRVEFKHDKYYLIGALEYIEENIDDPLISLTRYTKMDYATNEVLSTVNDYTDQENVSYVFRLSDVDHIEVFRNNCSGE